MAKQGKGRQGGRSHRIIDSIKSIFRPDRQKQEERKKRRAEKKRLRETGGGRGGGTIIKSSHIASKRYSRIRRTA